MDAGESSKACASIKYSDTQNLAIMNSKTTTNSKQSINNAAVTNEIHYSKDNERIKNAQLPHSTIKKDIIPSPNAVMGDHRPNARGAKRVIRKVMVIDQKKLQQAGLDRKLAEAIGRQNLKALAKEKNIVTPNSESNNLLTNKPSVSNTKLRITSTEETLSTTYAQPIPSAEIKNTSPLKITPVATTKITTLPIIKTLEPVKNVLLKSPTSEIATSTKSTIPDNTVSKSPAPERKVFVAPKITITRPGEELSTLRIIPEHRLENVKYILQCKILKRQQAAAHDNQATQAHETFQTFQSPTTSTSSTSSLDSSSHYQMSLIQSKYDAGELKSISKPMLPQKPSPIKTSKDIARAIDFSARAAAVSSATVPAAVGSISEGQSEDVSDSLRIKNYSLYAPIASSTKAETVSTRAIDVARLVARIGNVSMRKDLDQSSNKAGSSKHSADIPKATIRCKNLPVEMKNNDMTIKKADSLKKIATGSHQVIESLAKLPSGKLPTLKNSGLAAANKTVKLVYKAPMKQRTDNDKDKTLPAEKNAKQHNIFLQLKDFAAFSPFKQPRPAVIDPQSFSLPPNTTLKVICKAPSKQLINNENNKTVSSDHEARHLNDSTQLKNYPVFSTLKQSMPVVTQSQDLSISSNKTVKLVYKAPSKQTIDNEIDKPSIVDPKDPQVHELLQFKEFPAFSPLKQPFPVVKHSQDLFLPTITTFKTPFPTTLTKDGQPDNLMKINYVVKAGEEIRSPHSPKSLIVLENKVLSHDEKIDLTALGFGKTKVESTSEVQPKKEEEPLQPPYNLAENKAVSRSKNASISTFSQKNILPDGSNLENRTSLSMDKLKLSAEKIADLVNIIKTKKQVSVVRKTENASKPSGRCDDLSKINPCPNATTETLTQPATTLANEGFRPQSERNYEIKSKPLSDSALEPDTEIQFKNPLPRIGQKTLGTEQFRGKKSSVSVIDSGDELDGPISAVDFIASLAAEHPITEDMQLELSPEELNLNASFTMNFSPLRISNRDRTESMKSEISEQEVVEAFNATGTNISPRIFEGDTVSDDVQIGKIITISEDNILKAVAASKISNEITPTETQEVFKLTKITEFLERHEESWKKIQSENTDLNKDHLTESTVGSLFVKNIEVGVINNFEKPKSSQVIVKTIGTGVTASFGKLSETEGSAVDIDVPMGVKTLPIESEACNILTKTTSDNAWESILSLASTLDVKTTDQKEFNVENNLSLEDNSIASVRKIEKDVCEVVKTNPSIPPAKCLQMLKEVAVNENIKSKEDQMENSKLKQLKAKANTEASEKIKAVGGESTSSAPKRLPRFKKGKVNLVQRKKTVVTAQETNAASTNASEIANKAETDQKEIHKETVVNEFVANANVEEVQKTADKPSVLYQKQQFFADPKLKMDEHSPALIEQTTVPEISENSYPSDFIVERLISEIPAQVGRVSTEPLLKSSHLKRKTVDISQLLQPPKMQKQNINTDSSTKDLVDQTTNNIPGSAVKAMSEHTELTPVKNPFKKANTGVNDSDIPVKGIQNLLIIKLNKVKEKLVVENEGITSTIEISNISAESQDANKLDTEHLSDSITETSAKTETKAKLPEPPEEVTKLNSTQKSPKNSDDNNAFSNNLLEQETKQNSNIKRDTENCEIDNVTSKGCDKINVIVREDLEVNTTVDIEADAKIKSDFFGFDHNSPSTHSIESNLQHILTITNSAEQTKIRDENYSTTERESPHIVKTPKKSWLATGKTTFRKSKFGQARRSTNRRSVPLKKRWGVMRESEDDIEIADDISPAVDDDDEERNCGKTKEPKEANTANKGGFGNLTKHTQPEFFNPTEKLGIPNDITDENKKLEIIQASDTVSFSGSTISLTESKKRKRSHSEGIDTRNQPNETVTFSENASFSEIEPPSKKLRVDTDTDETETKKRSTTKGGKATKSVQSSNEPKVNIAELTDGEAATNIRARRSCSRVSRYLEAPTKVRIRMSCCLASADIKKHNEQVTEKPKGKRGRKPKGKVDSNGPTETQLVTGSETAKKIMESVNDSNQSDSTKDFIEENKMGSIKSQQCQRRSKKFKVKATVVDGTDNEIGQTKCGKQEGGPKTNGANVSESGRKHKAKVDSSESTETQPVSGTEIANKIAATLTITESVNDSNQSDSTKDFIEENKMGSIKSQQRQRRSKKFKAEPAAVDETDNEIGQPKCGTQKEGTKTNVAEVSESEKRTFPGRKAKSLNLSTSLTGVQIKKEFVKTDKELTVPSIFEIDMIQEALEVETDGRRNYAESKSAESLSRLKQEVSSSFTPTSAQLPADGTKKSKRNCKPLGGIVVTLAKTNEAAIVNENISLMPKKRGRKPKSLNVSLPSTSEYVGKELNDANPESSINTTADNVSQAVAEADTLIKIPKKRGRKPKAVLAASETPAEEQTSNLMTKQKRSKVVDLETRGTFNERLLLVTKRTQLDADEVLTVEPVATTSNTKDTVCGLCLQQMNRDIWLDHLATHYGVGWIVGEMTPTNVTIRNEVLKAMAAFLKTTAGRYPLTCRMCNRTFRSALGTLLHIELCGAKDTRVPCDYCKREYSKLGVAHHMRECGQRILNRKEEADNERSTTEIKEAVFNNVGRMKRASVQKAEQILKVIGSESSAGIITLKDAKHYIKLVPGAQFENLADKWTKDLESLGKARCAASNCSFESQELTTLQSHFENCELKATSKASGVYICQLCVDTKKSYNSAKHAMKHVLKHHKNTEEVLDFEAEVSDCGVKTGDESSDYDDLSSGVDSNEESESGDRGDSSFEEGEEKKYVSRKRSRKKQGLGLTNAAIMERLHPMRDPNFSRTAPELWKEFASQNYSTQPLFTDIGKVNYIICERVDYEKYLPRAEYSMKFNMNPKLELTRLNPKTQFGKAQNMQWSQLQRFQTHSEKNDHLIFIGEAIKIVKWVPLPADVQEQYLLIATRHEYTRYKNPKIGNTLVWLYKIKQSESEKPVSMELHYAVNIIDGPVHCVEFLPSGGYDSSINRLGVVAIGTPSSTIKVYTLPLIVEKEAMHDPPLTENVEHRIQELKTITLQPVFLLTLDISKDDALNTHPFVNTQCSSLCWSEFSEHKHIFAGFANGCVSYWDISTEMNLNRFVIDGVPNYVPMNFFYTREKKVHAMALHYDTSGVRVLAVTVGRRLLLLYDLHQFDRPLLLKEEIARSEVLDLEWSPIWQSLAVAISACLSNVGQCVYAVGPTNIAFKNETIDKMNGAVTQIHYNPVQHIFANTTDNGDIVLLNIREMYLKEIVRDSQRNSRGVAIMDVKSLNGEDIPKMDPEAIPSDWRFFESDYSKKYGLVFGPLKKIEKIHKPQYLSDQRRPPINLIHCTRINSMRCNINTCGKKLIALGYENGFLRILNIDRKTYFY